MPRESKLWLHKPSGHWCISLGGKRYYCGKNKAKAEVRRKEILHEAGLSRGVECQDITLHRLLNEFYDFEEKRHRSGRLAFGTVKNIHEACARCLAFFGKRAKVSAITPKRFTEFRVWLDSQYSLTTIVQTVGILRRALRFGVRHHYLKDIPEMGECQRPSRRELRTERRKRGQTRVFTPEEFKRLLDVSEPMYKAAFLLAANAGLGPADLAGLHWSHIDGDRLQGLRVKSSEPRAAVLWPETLEALSELPRDYDAVFADKWGQEPTRHNFQIRMKTRITRAGLDHVPNDLRHSCATYGQAAADDSALQRVMGHVDSRMLETYLHQTDWDRIRKVCMFVHDQLLPTKPAILRIHA